MLSEQSKNEELVANQLRFDLKLDGEQVMNSASAKVGPPHEIKIDESHDPCPSAHAREVATHGKPWNQCPLLGVKRT